MKTLVSIAIIFTVFSCYQLKAQSKAGQFSLEIVNPTVSINTGFYRGRTPQTDGFFNQGIAGFGQIYFPFQLSIDYRSNFSDSSKITNEYNNRIFLIRSSALFHVVDNGSLAFGLAFQFSWLIVKQFYIEYQLSPIYLEAPKTAAPDLNSGFNLHHFVSISKPIHKHFSVSLGLVHLSNAGIVSSKTSNQDVFIIGVKCNF
jgi:hypothetical protein